MSDKPRAVLRKPFVPNRLNDSEKELAQSFGRDNWETVTAPDEFEKLETAVRLAKSERTNIRLSEVDLQGIKEKAREKGLGYQTLIQSIIHQYVSGTLVEYSAAVKRLTNQAVVSVTMKLKESPKKSRTQASISRRKTGKVPEQAHR